MRLTVGKVGRDRQQNGRPGGDECESLGVPSLPALPREKAS
jgi:hypothetical protein